MAFQTWMADVLRGAGLPVEEEPGWRTRSADEDEDASSLQPEGLVIHETRPETATSTVAGEIRVLINGRTGLSGPIAQLFLARSATFHTVAAGLCHHAKTGTGGPFVGKGNTRLIGIEAQHAESESWADKPGQYRAYVRGAAAICQYKGWTTAKIVGHKEHQPGDKPDPEFDMNVFRADVAAVMRGEKLMILVRLKDGSDGGKVWLADGIHRRWVTNQDELTAIQAAAKAGHLSIALGAKYFDVPSLAPYGVDIAELGTSIEVDAAELAAKVSAQVVASLREPEALTAIAVAVADEDHRRSAD